MSKSKSDLMTKEAKREDKDTKRIDRATARALIEQIRKDELQCLKEKPKILKDFRIEPEKYQEIKTLCRDLNVKVSDQVDVSDILEKVNLIKEIATFALKLLSNR